MLILFSPALLCQDATIGRKDSKAPAGVHKVMLIPFEQRLYLSEIDHNINTETKLTPRQIRNRFRDGLNDQLYHAFKTNRYNVLDLMDDTVKYKKDIEGIYQYIAYDYVKVPDQVNFKAPKKEKGDKKIEKGQLIVETNSDARFMNARMTDARVVPLLYGKYRTDIFVFINQLDIRSSGPGYSNMTGRTQNRKIVVHYTVYSHNADEINSGIAETEFAPTLNNPKKIIDRYFSQIANTIVQRVTRGLTPAVK
jgi:hypothetical protein